MRPDSPSRFETTVLSADTTITGPQVQTKGLFAVTVAGTTITLPAPDDSLCGYECLIANHSDNTITISCTNGFPNDGDSISLAAGAGVFLYCASVDAGTLRWISIGATAS